MKTRLTFAAIIAAALCFCTYDRPTSAAEELGIGSKAPSLDIEHWIQDGNGFFKPVKNFDKGKVYVVEFWATWCGPCIQSMPHLAELQNKYRDSNVQIVSVSDESLDEVKDLLGQEKEEGKTFSDITSAYSLTTDPDRSVHESYMEAANQQGIPTSFLVGKSGVIEWIGHPMELDEPLEAVVNDSWDREAFKKELEIRKQFEENMQQVQMLAGAGRFKEALAVVDAQIASSQGTPTAVQWQGVGNQLKLKAGMIDDEVVAFFRDQLGQMKGDPYAVGRFAFMMYGEGEQGNDVGPLAADALEAAKAELDDASPDLKPLLYNAISLLHMQSGELDAAVEAQQAAVDNAPDERIKERLQQMLDQLKKRIDAESDASSEK